MRGSVLVVCLAGALAACGGRSSSPPQEKRDGGIADAPVAIEIPARPLGAADVSAFHWRQRPAHPTFRTAREQEAAGDWAGVVATCKAVLAADPTHLEAAWLLAVGFAKTGKLDEILAPLHQAAAGDFGKWGHASLELPSLQPWLATPTGQAWRRRVDEDRVAYLAALERAMVVNAGGDLFGFDVEGKRWYRLTRTFGALFAAMRVPDGKRILYLTRQRVKGQPKPQLALGMVDFARGRTSRPVSIGSPGPAVVAYVDKAPTPGAWIGTGMPKQVTWRQMDDDGKLAALPPKTKQPPGPHLAIYTKTARLEALPVADVVADWDGAGLASAIRIGKSTRVITLPSPAMIDGNTLSWSPSKTHLAFVSQLDDRCPPPGEAKPAVVERAAAYVADAATGSLRELERAVDGLVVEWISDRKLAVAGDRGVSIVDLDAPEGTTPPQLAGADGLVAPRRKPKCTPDPVDVPIEDPEPNGGESGLVEPIDGSGGKPSKN